MINSYPLNNITKASRGKQARFNPKDKILEHDYLRAKRGGKNFK
jgi:hypothetical protein